MNTIDETLTSPDPARVATKPGARAPLLREQRLIESRELLGTAREVRIVHNGETYSLCQTRLGKLILTK